MNVTIIPRSWKGLKTALACLKAYLKEIAPIKTIYKYVHNIHAIKDSFFDIGCFLSHVLEFLNTLQFCAQDMAFYTDINGQGNFACKVKGRKGGRISCDLVGKS